VTRVPKGGKRAQLDSFENTRDLFGDLLGAKNAGVTNYHHGIVFTSSLAQPQPTSTPTEF
jgi:hypothetical protein